MNVYRPENERFFEKFRILDNGCLEWTAGKHKDGYGVFSSKTQELAHRWAYEYHKGPIPKDKELDHLCRNRACVNPDHLEAVSHAENINRGQSRERYLSWRKARTHCKRGHAYKPDNIYIRKGITGPIRKCKTCAKMMASKPK